MSKKAIIIGITTNLMRIDTGSFFGRERAFVGRDYVNGVSAAGGVPILLPVIFDRPSMREQIDLVDGLILSGGQDVVPSLYGEEPSHLLESTYPERDAYEIEMARLAYERQIPIFGICRGLQLLNVAFGGTLYQDLSQHSKPQLQHSQKSQPHVGTHTVEVNAKTKLFKMVKQKTIQANSFHHQAVKGLAPGFIVNAKTKDDLIEGIEKEGSSFVLGVQWHPELMHETCSVAASLFQGFVNHCNSYGAKS